MTAKKKTFAFTLFIFFVVVVALFLISRSSAQPSSANLINTQSSESTNSLSANETKDSLKDETVGQNDNPNSKKSGEYIEYSNNEFTPQTNVIFFAADWCPSCRRLDRSLNEDSEKIPASLTIYKANYDLERDLKIKHGVTYQHTLVQVDSTGNQIKKWNGGNSIEDILKNII